MWTLPLLFSSLIVCCFLVAVHGVVGPVDLPLGDVNVVVLTDTHSWVSGHGRHEDLDATYAHVLSFVERLKEMESDRDIWFVMNGDFNDGTGLSQPAPSALTSILEQMPWDALTIGNHELYLDETVRHITKDGGFIQWFGSRYVTSNVVHSDTRNPFGHRYLLLEGKHSKLLVFGFLYEMDYGSDLKTIELIHDVLNASWFVDVMEDMKTDVDAILILAHMDLEDDLVHLLLEGLRYHVGKDMPIQFITGHTHYRGYAKLDNRSATFEAGRYLDTVGFVSFPTRENFVKDENDFEHVFLDAKVSKLSEVLGLDDDDRSEADELLTFKGQNLLDFIDQTREHLGIDDVIGCSPRTFYLNSSLHAKDSIWALYKEQVVPLTFPIVDEKKKVIIQNKRSNLRYSLFEGNTTLDDAWVVNPFNESFYQVAEDVPTDVLLKLQESLLETYSEDYLPQVPEWILIGVVEENETYDIYTGHFDVPALQEALKRFDRAVETEYEPQSINYGTTQIWIDFIKQEWPNCSTHWHLEDDEVDLETMHRHHRRKKRGFIGVIVAIALTLGILFALRFRNRQAINEELTVQELLRLAREHSDRSLAREHSHGSLVKNNSGRSRSPTRMDDWDIANATNLHSIDFETDDVEATRLT